MFGNHTDRNSNFDLNNKELKLPYSSTTTSTTTTYFPISTTSTFTSMNQSIDRQFVADSATVSLTEAQNESLIKCPSRSELKWRRMDPSLDAAVAPLLQKPLVPFLKKEKAKAHKSAIYYSECFLQGITPNDADRAALDIDSQYQKWWIKSAYQEEKEPLHSDENDKQPQFNGDNEHGDQVSMGSSKRKSAPVVVCDDGRISHSQTAKRRRGRGNLRNVIDDVTFELHQQLIATPSKQQHGGGGVSGAAVVVAEEVRSVARVLSDDQQLIDSFNVRTIPNLSLVTPEQIEGIRDEILDKLRDNGGDIQDPTIKTGLSILESYYLSSDLDARQADDSESFPYDVDGTWLTLSRPTFTECRGKNRYDEYIYSIGRMSFDMFRPTNLQCSIQGIFNTVQMLDPAKGELPFSMPRRIRKELGKSLLHGVKGLRTYNIIVAFTIEPNQSRTGKPANESRPEDIITQPIRGIMTNYGYLLPDPNVANRVSVWFTGGSLEVNDEEKDLEEWKKIFGKAPNRDMSEFARLLAAKVLLGATVSDQMEENGTLSYTLKRPIGGHGSAFCDVLYMDEKLRVMRGHSGSLFAFSKVKQHEDCGC